jgi:hypothetical protein
MKFITAIFNHLHGSKFGGRLNRDRHYAFSIRTLANLGQPMVCYIATADMPYVQEYLDKHEVKNIEFREYDLESFEYHQKIQEIKEINKITYAEDNVWEYRSVELMWLKLFWLKQEADTLADDEKVFWIDAGLSHGGIMPKKFNENPLDEYEQSFRNTKAFNPKLSSKLDNLTQESLFTFYCNNRQHHYPPLYSHDTVMSGSVVAGLFGGKASDVKILFEKGKEIIDYIVTKDTLLQEELILTLVHQNNPGLFRAFDFDTWYHEDWDCFDPKMKSFSAFFEGLA